jgi:hypothetical protein
MDLASQAQQRHGASLPAIAVFSVLSMLASVKADRVIFVEWSSSARLTCLSLLGILTSNSVDPLGLAMIGLPASLIWRRHLMQPGGAHLLWSIIVSSQLGASIFRLSWARARLSSKTISRQTENVVSKFQFLLLQVGCWYFVPYYHGLLPPIEILFNQGRWRWRWLLAGVLFIWSSSSVLGPVLRMNHAVVNASMVHLLHDIPLRLARTCWARLRRCWDSRRF